MNVWGNTLKYAMGLWPLWSDRDYSGVITEVSYVPGFTWGTRTDHRSHPHSQKR